MAFRAGHGWRCERPDHVEWRFKSGPYAGGEVRTFVPPHDITFGDHRPITIEARLYLNGKYRRLVKKRAIIEGGPDDPDLAAAVASLTQHLLSPSRAHRSTCPKSLCCGEIGIVRTALD